MTDPATNGAIPAAVLAGDTIALGAEVVAVLVEPDVTAAALRKALGPAADTAPRVLPHRRPGARILLVVPGAVPTDALLPVGVSIRRNGALPLRGADREFIACPRVVEEVAPDGATRETETARPVVPSPESRGGRNGHPARGGRARAGAAVTIAPPPHDLALERNLVGALMMAGALGASEEVRAALGVVGDGDFYGDDARAIFRAIRVRHESGAALDESLVRADLRDSGELARVGGSEAVLEILQAVPAVAHLREYALRVSDLGRRRRLIAALAKGQADLRTAADLDEALAAVESTIAATRGAKGGATALRFSTVEDLRHADDAEVAWVVVGLLARYLVTLLHAKPKAGKSTWTFALLAALERGVPFIGRETARTASVYLAEEAAATLVAKANRFGLVGARFLPRSGLPATATFANAVRGAAEEAVRVGAGVLVVDTLSHFGRLAADAEKDAGAVGALVLELQRAAARGLAVLVVHHSRKAAGDDGDAVRGSSALLAGVDIALELRRDEEAPASPFRHLIGLGRFEEVPTALVLRLGPVGYEVESAPDDGETGGGATSPRSLAARGAVLEALRRADRPLLRDDLLATVGGKKAAAGRALYALVAEGEVARDGEGRAGSPYLYRLPAAPEGGDADPADGGGEVRL